MQCYTGNNNTAKEKNEDVRICGYIAGVLVLLQAGPADARKTTTKQGISAPLQFRLPSSVGVSPNRQLHETASEIADICRQCQTIPGISVIHGEVARMQKILAKTRIVRQDGTFMFFGGNEKEGAIYYQVDLGTGQVGIKVAEGRKLNDTVIDVAESGDLLMSQKKDMGRKIVETSLMVVPEEDKKSQYLYLENQIPLPHLKNRKTKKPLDGLTFDLGSPPLHYQAGKKTITLGPKRYRSLFGSKPLLSNTSDHKYAWAVKDMGDWYAKYKLPFDEGLTFEEAVAGGNLRQVTQRSLREKVAQALSRPLPDVVVKFVDKKIGHGLFAGQDIDDGTILGGYTGRVRKLSGQPVDFTYFMSYAPEGVPGHDWFILDGKEGNALRFINHSVSVRRIAS